jgi:ethanolamine transporter EutH
MYEHRKHRPLTPLQFAGRVLAHTGIAAGAIAVALFAGIAGYHYIGGLQWVDALLNASMILGGMGPVDPLRSNAARVFASIYALFSGLVFIGVLAVVLAPFLHRLMHKLHMEESDSNS